MPLSSAIKIVIVYETTAVAVRGKEMSEALAAELQSEYDSWVMDLLAHPDLCRQAAAAAAGADMVIIAASGVGELPLPARNWIETWLPQKKAGPTALVLLLDEESESSGEPSPFCTYLSKVAKRGNMEFFCNTSHSTLQDSSQTDEISSGHKIVGPRTITAPNLQDPLLPSLRNPLSRSRPDTPIQLAEPDVSSTWRPPAGQSNAAAWGKETVLVVDDEPMVREMMVLLLRQFGYRVIEASGSLEAQRLAESNEKIHLLVTDFAVPQTNGLDLAHWFQVKRPEAKVLVTTGSVCEFVNQALEHERFAVLTKPFDGIQLGRMVRLVLDKP